MRFKDKRYGIPSGTDGRVIFFNKKLFAQAGLSADWQPKSWTELLTAARALKKLKGVTPIQLNAGTAMGEATAMQGLLPLLAGTGQQIYTGGKWQGDTAELREVLSFYQSVYAGGLGDKVCSRTPRAGRSRSPRSPPARSAC